MNIITLDFETFFSDEYTLSNMTTEEYVRDSRFEAHGVGIRWSEYPDAKHQGSMWYYDDIQNYLMQIDWSETACLCHHAHFDGLILSHHYGIKPRFWLDTLSMARLLIGNHLSVSLESLAKHFNLGAKNVPYNEFRGKHWDEMSPQLQRELADGCSNDCDLTFDLYQRLAVSFPQEEYALVDATVRMFTDPVLVGNTALLADIYQEEAAAKAALLDELGVSGSDIRKDWKFAELLRAEGVEPEQKKGKDRPDGTPKWNYSFAKSDDFMRNLLDSEDERVALLAETRLSEKSNITQTRTGRLGWMSTRGPMCVYLNYAGTHLAGWSGGDKVNWQNRKRGSRIDSAIEAPPGHLIIVRDSSQIECRLLNEIAGQTDVIERFRRHEDPYIKIASQFYGYEVTKDQPAERGTGKQLELSCGYGAGDKTIQITAKKGTYGPPVYLTDQRAADAKDLYRGTHQFVVALWTEANDVIKRMHAGLSFDWNVVTIQDKIMWLPNGTPLLYDTLHWHTWDDGQEGWAVKTRRGNSKLYGAKLVENLIQALRNVHIKRVWTTCREAGMQIVSMEHDKLIACVAEHEAQAAYDFMGEEMSRAPEWLPGIPLDSEGYISQTFAKPE